MMVNPYLKLKDRGAVERAIISQHGEMVSLSVVTEQLNIGQTAMVRASEAGRLDIIDGQFISAGSYADIVMKMKERNR